MNYSEAESLMNSARDRTKGKPIGANRRLFQVSDGYAIRYHRTDIVTIHYDDTYTLRTGGWSSVTTKKWINHYSPAYIWQKNWYWYIVPNGDWDKRTDFYDGIKVDAQGMVV